MSLGEAQVPIRATLDKLDGDLAKARGKIDGALGKLQRLGKISLAGIIGGIGAIGAAGTAAAVGIAKLAANAEPLVGLQSGFAATTERIGTSSETMLSALEDASGGLITNRDLMTSFNKAAALVGDDFAKQLPDAMGLVQKAAQATGQDFGFLMDSMVTGIGRLSPMIIDNLGLQVSLAEVTERAAEMFGKGAEELSKQEQQAALTQIVLEGLNEKYGEMETAAQPFARVRTMMANLRDEIGVKLLPVVAPLMESLLGLAEQVLPQLTGILEAVLPTLEGVSRVFGLFFDDLGRGMGPLDAVENLLARLSVVLGGNSETAQKVRDAFGQVVGAVQGVIDAVAPYIAMALEWISENIAVKDALIGIGVAILSVLIPALLPIIGTIAAIVATFAVVTGAVAVMRKAWESNFLGIRDKTEAAIEFVRGIITTTLAAISALWSAHGDKIVSVVRGYLEFAVNFYSTILNAIWSVLKTVAGMIQAAWAEHGEAILAKARQVWDLVTGAIEGAISTVQGIVESVAGAIASFWTANQEAIQQAAESVWEAIQAFIDGAMENLMNLLDGLISAFTGDWEGFGESIGEMWANSWETVTEILGTLWDGFKPLLDTLWTNIKGFFTDTDWASLGQAIIDGIKDGLLGAAGALYDAVRGIITGVRGEAGEAAGEGSPAKLFIPLGESIADGLMEGILGRRGRLERATEGVVRGLFDRVSSLAGIGGSIASIFKARTVDPLEEALAGTRDAIDEFDDDVIERFEHFAPKSMDDINALAGFMVDVTGFKELLPLYQQRNELSEEYQKQQETLLKLEKQRQDLSLLSAQRDLINLIRENNLDSSLLDGLELGLDADLGAILQATSAAMQKIIGAAEEELGIASPSKKFMELGRNITEGLKRGIMQPEFELGRLLPAMRLPGQDGGPLRNVTYSSTTTVHTDRDPMPVLRASRHLDKLGEIA